MKLRINIIGEVNGAYAAATFEVPNLEWIALDINDIDKVKHGSLPNSLHEFEIHEDKGTAKLRVKTLEVWKTLI